MAIRNGMERMVAVAAVLALAAGVGRAADATVSADLASAYVFRGATLNDGLVLQPALELGGFPLPETAGGLTLGVWGNLDIDDYDGALADGEISEVDLYIAYDLPIEAFSLSIGYYEYTYPAGDAEADREVSLTLGFDLPLTPSVDVFYGVDGAVDKGLYVEAGLEHSVELCEAASLDLAGAVGYTSPDEGDEGFSHYLLTAGISYSVFGASVTYVGQIDDDVLPDVENDGGYDVDVVGMLSASLDF